MTSDCKTSLKQFDVRCIQTGAGGRTEERKVNLWLAVMGPEGVDICDTFECGADEAKTYDVAISKFDDYCTPRSNRRISRCKFFR